MSRHLFQYLGISKLYETFLLFLWDCGHFILWFFLEESSGIGSQSKLLKDYLTKQHLMILAYNKHEIVLGF